MASMPRWLIFPERPFPAPGDVLAALFADIRRQALQLQAAGKR
jgi:hypothetical protein